MRRQIMTASAKGLLGAAALLCQAGAPASAEEEPIVPGPEGSELSSQIVHNPTRGDSDDLGRPVPKRYPENGGGLHPSIQGTDPLDSAEKPIIEPQH